MCELCSFSCTKRSNYNAHLTTKKHQKKTHGMNLFPETAEETPKAFRIENRRENECEWCNQTYKDRSGLWKHRKKCSVSPENPPIPERKMDEGNGNGNGNRQEPATAALMMNMIYELVKQNQEIKELLQRQNDQLVEQSTRPMIIQQQITNHAHANVSVNVFLREKCGGALNLTEFVDNLNVHLDDLEMVGRIGFVEGISRIILKELNRLDIYTRPIHCTDSKRETIYIREQNEWTRDTDSNDHTKRAIARVANKNLDKIPEWRKQHPETEIFDSPAHEMNMQIMIQSLGGLGGTSTEKMERNQEKILKRILPEVSMDTKQIGKLLG